MDSHTEPRKAASASWNALSKDDRRKADRFIQEIAREDTEILEFGTYLFGNWEEIRNLVTLDIPGSCTEGLVGHVLSERISRNPMGWSKEGLGKLSKLRVYNINGGKLTGKDLKAKPTERYSEYADRFIAEHVDGATGWSLFDKERVQFDFASGTQIRIQGLGEMRNTLFQ